MKPIHIIILLLTVVVEILLINLLGDAIVGALITLLLVLGGIYGYYLPLLFRAKGQLDKKCDPIGFLKTLKKLERFSVKNRKGTYALGINQVAGLALLGRYLEAKELLIKVGQTYKPTNKVLLFAFQTSYLSCLYEVGETDQAEALFKLMSSVYTKASKKIQLIMRFDKADRLYFLGRFEESKGKWLALQNEKLSNRQQVTVLYRLAQIAEEMGNPEDAKQKYKEVAARGNTMWIAEVARKKVSNQICLIHK